MTRVCVFPYPIYDQTKTSIPYRPYAKMATLNYYFVRIQNNLTNLVRDNNSLQFLSPKRGSKDYFKFEEKIIKKAAIFA